MEERIIIALDVKTLQEVKSLVEKIGTNLRYVKVGMELFYSAGPQVITYLKEKNLKIFLDLKLHDIPNTVYGGISSLLPLGIDMINVHTSGGVQMMKAAARAVKEFDGGKPVLIGVTQLTSISEEVMNNELKVPGDVELQVLHLATLAKNSGLDGVVCSPLESKKLKTQLGKKLALVTPGVRSAGAKKDDQARVLTPKEAFEQGSDYIVVGREVTKSQDPKSAFEKIVSEVC